MMEKEIELGNQFTISKMSMRYFSYRAESNDFKLYFLQNDRNTNYEKFFVRLEIRTTLDKFHIDWSYSLNGVLYKKVFENEKFAVIELSNDFSKSGSRLVNIYTTVKISFENLNIKKDDFTHLNLIGQNDFKDVKICVGSDSVMVHELVLAMVSAVFADIFNDSFDGNIVIDDFKFGTVKNAVNFIYSKIVDKNLDNASLLDLCKFADKYKLKYKVCLFLF